MTMSDESPTPLTLREAVAAMRIHAPSERNPKLAAFLKAANEDTALKARWHVSQINADRLDMSDHSWVHLQIVLNRALHLFRLLHRRGVRSAMEDSYGMDADDAEVVIAGGCLLHDIGMSIHRMNHEEFSLFLALRHLDGLLAGYEEPEKTVVVSEIEHAIIGHRSDGRPLTLEAGVVRVADAHDMEHGRSRVAIERLPNMHALSAAAINEVRIIPSERKLVRVEIDMNNSAGVFQVDNLLAAKLRGSGLEDYVEVVARIESEHEKRLLRVFEI
jgi:metal-dependent HD superfamily phosphatase/phosphodiesterase